MASFYQTKTKRGQQTQNCWYGRVSCVHSINEEWMDDGLTEERLIKSFVWRVFLVGGEPVIN
jgi:hypothetical protein